MIDRFETLCPQYFDATNLYFNDNVYDWVLYKEYNDYRSAVGNGGLKGVSYEELMDSFRTYSFYEGMDREKLCRTFRQRSLDDNPYDFEDFINE